MGIALDAVADARARGWVAKTKSDKVREGEVIRSCSGFAARFHRAFGGQAVDGELLMRASPIRAGVEAGNLS